MGEGGCSDAVLGVLSCEGWREEEDGGRKAVRSTCTDDFKAQISDSNLQWRHKE